MGAGVPLLVLCWVRYVVHLLLVLGFVLPTRGVKVLRSVRPSAQIARGSIMLLATLSFFTTLHYLPQAEATAINFLAPLIMLALDRKSTRLNYSHSCASRMPSSA